MKKFKLLILTILTVVSSAFLFACSTTETDNNVYVNKISLYRNDTELHKTVTSGQTTYDVTLYSGGEDFVIKYFVSPSNSTIGGVKITGQNNAVATYTLDNLNKTITITPAEVFTDGETQVVYSIISNDEHTSINLKVNLEDSTQYTNLATPIVNIENINGSYYAVWNNDAQTEEQSAKHFAGYEVDVNGTKTTVLTSQYKLETYGMASLVKVKALSTLDKNSNYSAEQPFTLYKAPKNISYSSGSSTISWEYEAGANVEKSSVIIEGSEYINKVVENATTCTFTPATNNTYTITVKAQDDSINNIYSESASIKITLLNIINAKIESNHISWQGVGIANSYTLYCYKDAQTTPIKEVPNAVSPYAVENYGITFEKGSTYTFKVKAVGNSATKEDSETNITYSSNEVVAGQMTKLLTPTALKVEEDADKNTTIKWEKTLNAENYEVVINNNSLPLTTANSYEYTFTGGHTVQVRAVGNGKNTLTSDYANIYVYKLPKPEISLADSDGTKIITWSDNISALTYGSKTFEELGANITNSSFNVIQNTTNKDATSFGEAFKFDLSSLETGLNSIRVYAKGFTMTDSDSNIDIYCVSSDNSNSISVNKLSQTTLKVIDGKLCWTLVPNASSYKLFIDGNVFNYNAQTELFPGSVRETTLENMSAGAHTASIIALGGESDGTYYFDSAQTTPIDIFKLDNNPIVTMTEGVLKFNSGVSLEGASGVTASDINYSYTLYKNFGTATQETIMQNFTDLNTVSSKISGSHSDLYTISLKVTAIQKGLISSNLNSNLINFHKLPNNFNVNVAYGDTTAGEEIDPSTAYATLEYTPIAESEKTILNVYKAGEKISESDSASNKMDLSLSLTEAGTYSFTLQAKGNTTESSSDMGYMTSDIYDVKQNGNTLIITVLDKPETVSVTDYSVLLGGGFNFNNPLKSSGNIIWNPVLNASGYVVYINGTNLNGDTVNTTINTNKTFISREEFAQKAGAGVYSIQIRAYGDGKNIIAMREQDTDTQEISFIKSDVKTITKLETITNIYTENNAIYFDVPKEADNTTKKYNNVSSVIDLLNPTTIYVEYVVGIKKLDTENYTYYTTYDFDAVNQFMGAGNTDAIIDLISSTKFTKLSNINGAENFEAGDYNLVVYTMPFNAKVSITGGVPVLSTSDTLYVTSEASSEYTVHITETVEEQSAGNANGFRLTDNFIRFNGNDVGSETLLEDVVYKFDANVVKVANPTKVDENTYTYSFEKITKTSTNNYLKFDGEDYIFKSGNTRYYYEITVKLGENKTVVIVPSRGTGNAEYNLNFHAIAENVAGDYEIILRTIVVGASNNTSNTDAEFNCKRLDSQNLQPLTTTILSTNLDTTSILKTTTGVLNWQHVVGAVSYDLIIKDELNTYLFKNILPTNETYETYTSVEKGKVIFVNKTILEAKTIFSVDFSEFIAGNYTIQIIANGDGTKYLTSVPSEEFNVTKLQVVNGIRVVNGRIWFKVPALDNGEYKFTIKSDGLLQAYYYSTSIEGDLTIKNDGENYYEIIFPKQATKGTYYFSFEAIGNSATINGLITSNPSLNFEDANYTSSYHKVTKLEAVDINSITIDANGNLSWKAISNSQGYYVKINNSGFNVSSNVLTNNDAINAGIEFNPGSATIIIYAKGNSSSLDGGVFAYVDGIFETETKVDVIKLQSLQNFNVRVENGIIVWDERDANNDNLQVPVAIRVTVSFDYDIDQNGTTENYIFNIDLEKYNEFSFDINSFIDIETYIKNKIKLLDLSGINYTISFKNLGGQVGQKLYTNSEISDPIEVQKLKNVDDLSNSDQDAISVECQVVDGVYQLDKIYFEQFDGNASHYVLNIVDEHGAIIKEYICKTENGELQIISETVGNYTHYIKYENTSITEGTYTITLQAIGNNNYLNSSKVVSDLFIVPNAPKVYVEQEGGFDTGRIYWNANIVDKETTTYIISYKFLTKDEGNDAVNKDSFALKSSKQIILNISSDYTITEQIYDENLEQLVFVKTNAIYDEGENKLYYSFLEMGHYLVTVTCQINGLPSKEGTTQDENPIIDFTFFNSGDGTSNNPYELTDITELNAIVYRPSAHYIFGDNITINSNYKLSEITFSGTINGNNKQLEIKHSNSTRVYKLFNIIEECKNDEDETISNIKDLTIIVNDEYNDGSKSLNLIAETNNGYIKDVVVQFNTNSTFLTFASIGTNVGTIEGVEVKGDGSITLGNTQNKNASAGSIALVNDGIITRCSNALNLKAGTEESNILVGGIVCTNNGEISKSYNTANLKGSVVGGICATNNKEIIECYNTGDIIIYDYSSDSTRGVAGGIVAECIDTKTQGVAFIEKCYNLGNIIAGSDENLIGYSAYIGGIVGYFSSQCSPAKDMTNQVRYCYSLGSISLNTSISSQEKDDIYMVAIGGIVGYLNDFNLNNRAKNSFEQRIMLFCYSNPTITISYKGTKESTDIISAGIAGYLNGIIDNCYTKHQNLTANAITGSSKATNCEASTLKNLSDFINLNKTLKSTFIKDKNWGFSW